MNAEIIAVGSELLTPYRLDTNSLFLTDELNRLGIRVIHKAVVGDSPEDLREALVHAVSTCRSNCRVPADWGRPRTT